MRKRIMVGILIFVVLSVTILAIELSTREASPVPISVNHNGELPQDLQSSIRLLKESKIIAYGQWAISGDSKQEPVYIVKAFDQDSCYEGTGMKFVIIDESGSLLYEQCYGEVIHIYQVHALRNSLSPQLALEVSYGGTDNFLEILDYQRGSVINLTSSLKGSNGFGAGAEVRPQFRKGITPSKDPFQILLTNPGLAGPPDHYTSVFRLRDGMYKYFGKFSQQQVDDYIEKLITRSR